MNLSSLAGLGQIAGLGGIALGIVVLLVRPIIDRTSSLPAAQRAPLLKFIAMGAFGIGALGIVAWIVGNVSIGNVTATNGGVAAGRDITGLVSTAPPPGGKTP